MAVYTVHAPSGFGVDVRTSPDKIVFVRDGFHFWAFVAGLLWLIWHRLWLALIGYLVVSAALEGALWAIGAGASTRMWAMAVVALFMGFEASSLRRWTLSRRKWRQIGLVVADDEQEAERKFFARWDGTVHAPAPARGNPALHPLPHSSLAEDAAGFFPAPGASQ